MERAMEESEATKSRASGQPAVRTILGIDPGTTVMGFGVIQAEGRQVLLVEAGALRIPAEEDPVLKLRTIYQHVSAIIERHRPGELAIEAQFFGKNVQSMLKLGRAQGVAIAAALQHGLAVSEYAPKRVKQSITGRGNATKEQVAAMVVGILRLGAAPAGTDASDAVAVALCHFFGQGVPSRTVSRPTRRSSGWEGFIRNHPQRVKR
ncbi:MAG: crossover junction endodeoxyribonuclease RuvC [Flavobacteriales bacterium]|nr:crossover junction endodeoxyribonuclease RuvC [Flavobacteriales bacterium]HRO40620.1 crossover junction endodeoxyribonuclease RuvC [Flavobacteriales bacterium]HRP82578.1 crossover junction endodeoxyribonuclease RuvC [Flavobacteriales bacterium]